jgi:hypothetical protein
MDKVEDLKKAKDGTDKDLIKKNYDALSETIQKIGAAMYQQQAGPSNGTRATEAESPQGAAEAGTAGEPVEAQYEEVKK